MQALSGSADPLQQTIEKKDLRPKKSDVSVRVVALAWTPHWKTPDGLLQQAYGLN
jgi:hypothetical protein